MAMSEKTEIWYLIGALRIGGTGKTLVNLANNLDTETYDIKLFTLIDDVPLREELETHVKFECLDANGKVDVTTAVEFGHRLRREQPDILQSFLFFDNNLARVVGKFAPETTVISGVRAVPNEWEPPRSWIDDLTLPLADYIVSNSEAGAEWVIDRGADPDLVSVVYNGRDVDRFAGAEAPASLFEELGVDGSTVVGTVGRLIERKGHYDLLEAWPAVLEAHPDATLLVVGDGPERAGLERTAKRFGCSDSVRFTGFREDVPELLDAMDLFVFPSHFEGLPGALIEAMAGGLPIVCTHVDGNAELILDGESGVYIDPESPVQLRVAITELLDDTESRERLGANAQLRASSTFSVEAMVAEFTDLYTGILANGEPDCGQRR